MTDGTFGWEDEAPFDGILVTAGAPAIPRAYRDQLAIGGRLVIPVGVDVQELLLLTRTGDGVERKSILPVRFVPMTGKVRQ